MNKINTLFHILRPYILEKLQSFWSAAVARIGYVSYAQVNEYIYFISYKKENQQNA